MDKIAFVGAVESNTIDQGAQKEFRPTMYWIIGIQTLVPALDPGGGHEPTLVPVGHGPEASGKKTVSDNHPRMTGLQKKSSSSPLE